MIIVTGGAGFIGSNIINGLNKQGHTDIIVVDDFTDGTKFKNLADCDIIDYLDKDEFLPLLQSNAFGDKIKTMFHQGACAMSTEWNGRLMLETNFTYSKVLLHFCLDHAIPFIYASSAAVYGAGPFFTEDPAHEKPLNVYGYSKFLFDQYVRRMLPHAKSQLVGVRYFNVYGPREAHKGPLASVGFHCYQQLQENGRVRLFAGHAGYGNGKQQRDFVYVGDAVKVNLWFMAHPEISGIFNLGTGRAQSFNEVAEAVIAWHQQGRIEYVPFPETFKNQYQSFTQADVSLLREAGYKDEFKSVQEGIKLYMDWLTENKQ